VSQYGVARVEVERAQRIIEARLIRRLEDMEGQATYLAEWEATGGWRLADAYHERMMSLSPEDLVDVARRYLDPGQASVLVYRPRAAPVVAPDGAAMQAMLGSRGAEHTVPLPRAPLAPRVAGASATLEREEHGVRVYRTAGGVPVLVRRKRGSPMVHAGVFALGGASEESERDAGLTSLMVRTAIKGTMARSGTEIAESGELLGAIVNASAGGESFGWSISVPATRFAQAVELLADIAQHATIPEPAFETERATALAEAAAERDDMFRFPIRLATHAAFHGHPYGMPTGGTEDSLREITVGAVRAWHRERALSGASVIAIVGDVDCDTLASAAETAFSELRYEAPRSLLAPSWPGGVVTAAETRDKAQTALVVLFPGPSRTADDRFTARLLASVASGLGGRFFDVLRDKQSLAYAVHAFGVERRLAGTVGAYIATSPENEARARDGLLTEFARFREAPPTDEELERARTYALGAHAIRQQRGAAVLGDMIDAWLNGQLAELSEFEARVAGVTRESMLALARRFFDPGVHVEGIVRGIGKPV
jgi:zinc protease